MLDITVLPVLAAFFDVFIDELLGIKPLKGDVYSSEKTDSEEFWDNHFEYIMRSRNESWNNVKCSPFVRQYGIIELYQ